MLCAPPLFAIGHKFEVDVVENYVFRVRVVCFEIG